MAMRVVLDTNVIVAGLAYPSGPPGRIMAAWRSGALSVVLSPWILTECERVLPRLEPYTHMSPADIRNLIDKLAIDTDVVNPDAASLATAVAAGVRDVADEPVLATLLASGAEWLVTGDKDLLALADRHPIITPARFCERHAP
jgi:uncharacterized protein